MGGVFFRRRVAPPKEVINDLNGDVVTFFRILQRHYTAFMDELRFRFTSRAEFERLMAVDPATCTDLERAARFLYLQRTVFGGKVAGRTYGTSMSSGGRFDVSKLGDILTALNERLAGVEIENLPWQTFLDRYDRAETLFYLDPPYWGSEDYYGKNLFPKDAFEELADRLAAIAGSFVLSINDVPEIRRIFRRFSMTATDVSYAVGGASSKRFGELIITKSYAQAATGSLPPSMRLKGRR